MIAVDLRQQKELDIHQKAVQEIEIIGQLKKLGNNGDATDIGKNQSMFVLKILEKFKETRLKVSQEVKRYYKRWRIMKKQKSDK